MKKIISITLLLLTCLCFTSCSKVTYIKRPEDTNLELWITEHVSKEQRESLIYIPGMWGGNIYLGSKYEPDSDKSYLDSIPEIHVVYTVTSYPDYSSQNACVTHIDITDKEVTVYGLTIDSPIDQKVEVLKNNGLKVTCHEDYVHAKKGNVGFNFYKNSITIGVPVTNKHNIVF